MSHACPNCGLTSPDTVAQCDCGYNFQSQEINFTNVVQPGDEQARRLPKLWVGFVFAALYFVAIPIEAVIRPDAFKEEHPFGFFVVFFVAGWFYWLFCVYRYHQIMNSIPGYRHPISENAAVARHFIPLYNMYWTFRWADKIAVFVNWRAQRNLMAGAIPGALVFLGALAGRIFDSGLGLLVLFGAGIYISRQMKKAFSSPPVPDSAIAPPGVTPTLGIG